ncbi:hypothetical protein Tco_1166325 [Tanacetum coccineum]
MDAPSFRMAASVKAQISLIKFEFSSCLFADSLINLLSVSSIDCLRSFERVDSNHTIKNKAVTLTPNQVLTKEVREDLKHWEKLIRENMLNLGATAFINVVDRVMHPLALKQTRRPRSDRGIQKARHSVSSSSTHHFGSSSHQVDDDNNEGTSRASTLSPNSYLNSLQPLTHQTYIIPTSSQQSDILLFERQTILLNHQQQMHEEIRGGFKLFGKAIKGVFGKKKK